MYQKIVVPLDGSRLAESVLPYIENLAQGCGTEEVILVSVTERVTARRTTPEIRDIYPRGRDVYAGGHEAYAGTREIHEGDTVTTGKKQKQAERYLTRKAKQLQDKGLAVRMAVLLGNPAQEIISYAEQNKCDLIAMTTHGRSGIDRWSHSIGAYGNVADKIIRASTLPVLMVPVAESKRSG